MAIRGKGDIGPGGSAERRRFWAKVDRRGANECWPWLGAVNRKRNYGLFWLNGGAVSAPRYAYAALRGDVPPRLERTCGEALCVNPRHFEDAPLRGRGGEEMVYVVTDGTAVKIGRTRRPVPDRMVELQTGNPRELSLVLAIPGGPAEEAELQRQFAGRRVRGEWYV